MWQGLAYWLGVCILVGATIYALLCKLDPLDDPFGDTPHGDWPQLPTDLKSSSFHGRKD